MDKDFQERQQTIGAEGRVAACFSAIHNECHHETSSMDPWLAHFGRLREGFLQTAHEHAHTLKLFSIECILPFWRGTSLLAMSSKLLGYMLGTLQNVRELDPLTRSLMLLQVVHHCISDAWVDDVVTASLAHHGAYALHVLHDGILNVECCRSASSIHAHFR